MVAQVETRAAVAMPGGHEAPPTFTPEELERMFEFDRIVKFRDTITSGKHPRIKVPQNLLPANTTSSTVPSARPFASQSSTAADASTAQQASSGGSSSSSSIRPSAGGLPGLGGVAGRGLLGAAGTEASKNAGTVAAAAKVEDPVRAQFLAARAKLEALLEQGKSLAGQEQQPHELQVSFDVNDVWKRGLERARAIAAPLNKGKGKEVDARGGVTVAAAAASADKNDSADDKTFYSSNFSTPESGLRARVSVESDNDDVSMQDSSDYEPELDIAPSPTVAPAAASQTDNCPPVPVSAPSSFSYPGNATAAPPPPTTLPQQWDLAARLLQNREFQLNAGAGNEAPRPPSPFVRAHDLSPVAPQPTHTAATATVEQLSSAAQQGGSGSGSGSGPRPESGPVVPAQVVVLRQEQRRTRSSSGGSAQTTASRGSERKKGKKKMGNKRKTELAAESPHIKVEPLSPAPLGALQTQRGNKRQRHASRQQEARPVRIGDFGHVIRENPPNPPAPHLQQPPPQPLVPPPFRDDRVAVVYEPRQPRREWDGYDNRGLPQYAPPSTHYAQRSVRSASHTLVETSPAYSRSARGSYAGLYEPTHMSVRPEGLVHEQSGSPVVHVRSPVMPPPTHIAVDEFGREYYEPPRPPAPRYDSEIVYERLAAPPMQPPQPFQPFQPMPYDAERAMYPRPASTAFVQPRRVATQPEYASYDAMGGPQREYPVLPPTEYGAAPPPREYLVRATTARPPEAPIQPAYEVPPPGYEYAGSPGGYDGRFREPAGGPFMGGGGYEAPVREYSVRPEAAGVPYYTEFLPPPPPPPPAAAPYPGYAYPEGGRRDMY